MRLSSDSDPLAVVLAPPQGESQQAKELRERVEADAKRVSDIIDEQLRQERIALKKKKKPVKVLLLGQSESGKSATLKNFQLHYARHEWVEEKVAWRAVIFLNLVRNIIHVLDVLLREMSLSEGDRRSPSADFAIELDLEPSSHTPVYRFSDKHRLLKLRIAPLRRVLLDLEKTLGPGSQEVYTSSPTALVQDESGLVRTREFGIISRNGWKSALEKLRLTHQDGTCPEPVLRRREEEKYEIADVIFGCREDMKNLWEDPVVQQILSDRKAHIEDNPGFFLNDIDRIAAADYEPSDDDIVRARLRTVGVQEHKFTIGEGQGKEWIMYDVGGTRSSRAVWASYFDDVDAIIFLSPISCFDERLREDSKVNRLEDSYQLWRSVCQSPMLAKTQIILFLNKCDLLHNKLKRGTRVKDSIPSYGDRKNDTITAMKYFQSHFKEIFKLVSPEPRPFFVHFTSVIGLLMLAAPPVEESILRSHLRNADLL
ncbi:guanine nucleotide binding protein, alpha subunit [Chiua virens]|nr:guanine nucleotide binding protein, alpha subunit [Chiua virens]